MADIKLVIKISEELYKSICKMENPICKITLMTAVAKGTPLIDADEDEDVLCHTNLKENAGLIAKILDADAHGEVFIKKIKTEIDIDKYKAESEDKG